MELIGINHQITYGDDMMELSITFDVSFDIGVILSIIIWTYFVVKNS